MLDVEVSPITSQQQNMDDRDCPALELHAITAVDWPCKHGIRLVLCINNYGHIEWVGNKLT